MISVSTNCFYKKENTALDKWDEKLARIKAYNAQQPARQPWRYFKRQADAFEYCDKQHNLVCFAAELDEKHPGKRQFFAAGYQQFWFAYKEMSPTSRHFYEVIRENAPCHLYLDLEFLLADNPNSNGNDMMDTLKTVLVGFLSFKFPNLLSKKLGKECFVELTSCTTQKFSRHLMMHIDNHVFKSQRDVGLLLEEMLHRLNVLLLITDQDVYEQELETLHWTSLSKSQLLNLYVWEKGERTIFLDLSVYSKNRNFRMYKSSKLGKQVCLEIAPTNSFPVKSEYEFWLKTLASHVEYHHNLVLLSHIGRDRAKLRKTPSQAAPSIPTVTSSSYPQIDAFVVNMLANMDPPGQVKNCVYFPTTKHLLFHISGNRYCHRIQRQHHRNNTYYVVELEQGTISQRCFDSDCKGYKGPPVYLPNSLNPFSVPEEDLFENLPELPLDDVESDPEWTSTVLQALETNLL
jgi:hypothetical protein